MPEFTRQGQTAVEPHIGINRLALERFAKNLSRLAREGKLEACIGREGIIFRAEQILKKQKKSNVVLIGDAGVGKTAIVEGLALRWVNENAPQSVREKELWELSISSLMAGASMRGEFEQRMLDIIADVNNSEGKIILFIDELHLLVGTGNTSGPMDAANILKPALARGEFQCIGATTASEYRTYIESDKALSRRFQKIDVAEPTASETIEMLMQAKPSMERFHHVRISRESVEYAVTIAAKYISHRAFPDKAVDLLDEAAALCQLTSPALTIDDLTRLKSEAIADQDFERAAAYHRMLQCAVTGHTATQECEREVSAENIDAVVSEWTGIPIGHFHKNPAEIVCQLESELARTIIGQPNACTAVVATVKKMVFGFGSRRRPLGVLLFLGETGVGKTEICRILAKAIFGSEEAMIRIDLSEYSEPHSGARLIGAPPGYIGYESGGQLTNMIRRKPFSLVVLDEFEKAHPDLHNLFLQIFEEGVLTDGKGETANFGNTIIVMTSNMALESEKTFGFSDEGRSNRSPRQQLTLSLRPELVNRVDQIIRFRSLNVNDIRSIAELQLEVLKADLMEQKGIVLNLSNTAVDVIAQSSYAPESGAREVRRKIQQLVLDRIAASAIDGLVKDGSVVNCTVENGNITLRVGS